MKHDLENPVMVDHWRVPYGSFHTREEWYKWIDWAFDHAQKMNPNDIIYGKIEYSEGYPSRLKTYKDVKSS